MRLWSIHPQYLDAKGLVALWREALLAKQVLEKKTKAYSRHPQLIRFKENARPVEAINFYLNELLKEAKRRNYNFDASKVGRFSQCEIKVTSGQIEFEFEHLTRKLEKRDPERKKELASVQYIIPHPLFTIVPGEVEKWEIR